MKIQDWSALGALKVIAYGGPIAMAMGAVGATILGLAFWDKPGEHYDVLIVLGVTLVIGAWVELALARRFHAHELVERRQYEYVASIADSAAQSLTEITRETRRHTEAVEDFRSEVRSLRAAHATLEDRVAKIEERWMRPGIVIPPLKHGSG
jgi:ABC-type transport system involved in cytochrome bd biosynthesis fused ATPase/permease subunit